jgi:signal transduction histidine kinase
VETLTEIASRDSEALRRLLDNIPVGIGIAAPVEADGTVRPDARIVYYNKRWVEMFGFDVGEVQTFGEATRRIYPDPEVHTRMLRLRKEAADGSPHGSYGEQTEIRAMGAGGRWLDLITGTVVVSDRLVVTMLDVSSRKQAELDLAITNARMNLAARVAQFGFWHFHVAEDREEWDANLCHIYGSDPGESHPRWEKFLHPEDREEAEKRLRKVLEQGGAYDSEFRIVRPDGVVRHIRESGFVVHDKEGRPISATGADIDVTEEKLAEQKRRESEQEHRAELERKLKTSLAAAAVAHEINQPLSAILLDSQMALARINGDSPELLQARQFLTSTVTQAERVVKTAERMMSLLRSVKTEHKVVDLGDVVRSAVLYAKDELRSHSVMLHTRGAKGGAKVSGDEGQLVLAVSNLLRNAIQAVASREHDAGQILVTLDRHKQEVTLAVGDNGPGLDESVLANAPLNTTKPEGTGLGLFIVQSVADNHSAKLEVGRSELGGAELRLIFPAAK